MNFTKPEINAYCIVAGDGDLIPLLVELKSSGRTLIDINTPYQEQNSHMFDTHLIISNMGLVNPAYQPKTKKVEKVVAQKKVTKVKKEVAPAPAPAPEPEPEEAPAPVSEEVDFDNARLSEVLRDITTRYSALDFSDNSDMDKKLELITDIENLIEEETAKGEGLDSDNADVRQIFVELQSIVDDMKSAL